MTSTKRLKDCLAIYDWEGLVSFKYFIVLGNYLFWLKISAYFKET